VTRPPDTRAPLLEELAAALAAREPELLDLLQALIRAPSPSPPGDEREAVAVVERYLADVPGIERSVLSRDPRRPNALFAFGEGPALLLCAHTDTVPAGRNRWSVDPYAAERVDGHVVGLGASDNKAAVAAMAVAFRTLAERAGEVGGRIVFCANADEEQGGGFGIQHVIESWDEDVEAAVVAEPSGIDDSFERLWVASRGTACFRIDVSGTSTHSSLSSRAGTRNAIDDLLAVWHHFRPRVEAITAEHPAYPDGLLFNPVLMSGGADYGIVPEAASLGCDLRVVPGVSRERVDAALRQALADASSAAGVEATLSYHADPYGWIEPLELAPDELVLRAAEAGWRDTFAADPEFGGFPGGSDARLLAAAGIPALPGVGPGALMRAHAPDEYVAVSDLVPAAVLYTAISLRYFELRDGRAAR
jgi:acetylornithine deacetylase/succinyl-diaminopimelate desuccinylase-like protein